VDRDGTVDLVWFIALHFVVLNASGLAIRAASRYERFGA
jgi:hypothetical protein